MFGCRNGKSLQSTNTLFSVQVSSCQHTGDWLVQYAMTNKKQMATGKMGLSHPSCKSINIEVFK